MKKIREIRILDLWLNLLSQSCGLVAAPVSIALAAPLFINSEPGNGRRNMAGSMGGKVDSCLLYTSDAADE